MKPIDIVLRTVAFSLLILIIVLMFYAKLNPQLFMYHSEITERTQTDPSNPPEYICKQTKCYWDNVPYGKENIYISNKSPFLAKVYHNQNILILLSIVISIFVARDKLLEWYKRKRVGKNI
jgi:hypothetical protein